MAVSGVNSERNYTTFGTDKANTDSKVYNAVFQDEEDDSLSVNDFLNLMITQLTNQDFTNPVDDTQYLAQMAQFSTMQEMADLCKYSKQNYVMSMLGKEVTVSSNNIGGGSSAETGVVEKIAIEDNKYKVYVNGQAYDMSKVSQIGMTGTLSSDKTDTSEGETEES